MCILIKLTKIYLNQFNVLQANDEEKPYYKLRGEANVWNNYIDAVQPCNEFIDFIRFYGMGYIAKHHDGLKVLDNSFEETGEDADVYSNDNHDHEIADDVHADILKIKRGKQIVYVKLISKI